MTEALDRCFECGRKAKWLAPINRIMPPKLLCGYHKRAYTNGLRLLPQEPVASSRSRSVSNE
jgi:hypothetical protein